MLRSWSEASATEPRTRIVTLVQQGDDRLFAALVQRPALYSSETLLASRVFRPEGDNTAAAARKLALRADPGEDCITVGRPSLRDWKFDCVEWRVMRGPDGRSVQILAPAECAVPGTLACRPDLPFTATGKGCPAPPRSAGTSPSEDLADDDLHHRLGFAGVAATVTAGLTSRHDIVDALLDWMDLNYEYTVGIDEIDELTQSDHVTCACQRQRGRCDDFAVTLVALLRSLNVPAHEVIFVFDYNTVLTAHAGIEYQDEAGNWIHADPTCLFHDQRGGYVDAGAQRLSVMRPYAPRDDRASIPVNGVDDPPGDGSINPFCDWLFPNAYPGLAENVDTGWHSPPDGLHVRGYSDPTQVPHTAAELGPVVCSAPL